MSLPRNKTSTESGPDLTMTFFRFTMGCLREITVHDRTPEPTSLRTACIIPVTCNTSTWDMDYPEMQKISMGHGGHPQCLRKSKRRCVVVTCITALVALQCVLYWISLMAGSQVPWVQTDQDRLEGYNGHASTGLTMYSVALTPSQILAMGTVKASKLHSVTLYDDSGVIHTHQLIDATGPAPDGSVVLLVSAETGIRIADGPRGVQWGYVRVEQGFVVVPEDTGASHRQSAEQGRGNVANNAGVGLSNNPLLDEENACSGDHMVPEGGDCRCVTGYTGTGCTVCDPDITAHGTVGEGSGGTCSVCSGNGEAVRAKEKKKKKKKRYNNNENNENNENHENHENNENHENHKDGTSYNTMCVCEDGWTGHACADEATEADGYNDDSDDSACSFGAPIYTSDESTVHLHRRDGSFTLGPDDTVEGLNTTLFNGFRYHIINLDPCLRSNPDTGVSISLVWGVTLVVMKHMGGPVTELSMISNTALAQHTYDSLRINDLLRGGTLAEASNGHLVYNGMVVPVLAERGTVSSLEVISDCNAHVRVQFWPLCGEDKCVQGGCTCIETWPWSSCGACVIDDFGAASCNDLCATDCHPSQTCAVAQGEVTCTCDQDYVSVVGDHTTICVPDPCVAGPCPGRSVCTPNADNIDGYVCTQPP